MAADTLHLPIFAGLRHALEVEEMGRAVTRNSPTADLRAEMERRGCPTRINTPRLYMLQRLGLAEDA